MEGLFIYAGSNSFKKWFLHCNKGRLVLIICNWSTVISVSIIANGLLDGLKKKEEKKEKKKKKPVYFILFW